MEKAKQMAQNDKELLALIEKTEKSPFKTKGALGGAIYTSRRVQANFSYSFTVSFAGGRYAEIRIVGDGDTDLDFYVYDQYGYLVGSDEDYTDRAYFTWYPSSTQIYKFVVKNRGNVYNNFRVITN